MEPCIQPKGMPKKRIGNLKSKDSHSEHDALPGSLWIHSARVFVPDLCRFCLRILGK
jgi:hypothetical protein